MFAYIVRVMPFTFMTRRYLIDEKVSEAELDLMLNGQPTLEVNPGE
jgi:hypothetical protein